MSNAHEENSEIWAQLEGHENNAKKINSSTDASDDVVDAAPLDDWTNPSGADSSSDQSFAASDEAEEAVEVTPNTKKKSQLPYFIAAGSVGVIVLGIAGVILNNAFGDSTPTTAKSVMRPMQVALDSSGSTNQVSLPGGGQVNSPSGQTPSVSIAGGTTSSSLPDMQSSLPASSPSSNLVEVPQVATASSAVPVAPTTSALTTQSNALQMGQASVSTPSLQVAKQGAMTPSRATPEEEVISTKSTPAAAKKTTAHHPRASKPAPKSQKQSTPAKNSPATAAVVFVPPRFRIMAFAPATGQFQMAHLWDETQSKQIVVREGDVLPDGNRITKVDSLNWTVGMTTGSSR